MTYDQLVTSARNSLEMLGHVPEVEDDQAEDDEPFEPG
jgi:hypothetical protein